MEAVSKICKKCGETKALELFSKAARGKDGYAPRCKACVAEYDKKLRELCKARNPELFRAKNKTRYERYKAVISERQKIHRQAHRDEINKRESERRAARFKANPAAKARSVAIKHRCYERNKDHILNKQKQRRETLCDSYIVELLTKEKGKPRKQIEIPQGLIEVKRLQVLISRRVKNEKRNTTTK